MVCTQNIQNDCHYLLSNSFRVHQILFRPGSAPDPIGGAYSAHPDPPAGLRGPTSKVKGEGGGRDKERRRAEEAPSGRNTPLSQIPGLAPGLISLCQRGPTFIQKAQRMAGI